MRFRTILDSYYQNSHGAVLLYDITKKETFQFIKETWFQDIQQHSSRNTFIALIGNKNDLSGSDDETNQVSVETRTERWGENMRECRREVLYEEGMSLARELGLHFFMECNTQSKDQVEEIVMRLSAAILQHELFEPTPQTTIPAPGRRGQNSCSLL
jgi:GTPase SAR1 family protein